MAAPSAVLQSAVAIFDTQDENKDKDTSVTVQVKTRGGKMVAEIRSAAASNNDSTQYRPFTTASVNLMVDSTIQVSECNDLALWVDTQTVGTDTWRFKVRVELYFSDGTKVIRSSSGVEERGGALFPGAQHIVGEVKGPTQIIRK